MKKQFCLLLLTIVFSLSGTAQEPTGKPLGTQKKHRSFARHDFRLTVGAYPILNGDYGWWFGPVYYDDLYIPASPNFNGIHDISYNLSTVYGDKKTAGSYSLSYMFSPAKWFSVGAYATYANINFKYYDRRSGQRNGKTNIDHFLFTPTIRFTYLNRPIVQLYSQLGIGIGRLTENWKYEDSSKTDQTYREKYCSIQLTLFGVSVGRRLYGFAEIGSGSIGCINAGIGYRF